MDQTRCQTREGGDARQAGGGTFMDHINDFGIKDAGQTAGRPDLIVKLGNRETHYRPCTTFILPIYRLAQRRSL